MDRNENIVIRIKLNYGQDVFSFYLSIYLINKLINSYTTNYINLNLFFLNFPFEKHFLIFSNVKSYHNIKYNHILLYFQKVPLL